MLLLLIRLSYQNDKDEQMILKQKKKKRKKKYSKKIKNGNNFLIDLMNEKSKLNAIQKKIIR